MTLSPQVHDLIRIDPNRVASPAAPAWVAASLQRAPWVVVRRACTTNQIPIGVRGSMRARRFAGHIAAADIRELLGPQALIERIGCGHDRFAGAARVIAIAADALAIHWGPAGAYAFELASGLPATHAGSDLDIVVWPAAPATLRAFADCCTDIERASGVRIDADVLFGTAGIALRELVSGAPRVLAKTPAGPRLVATPQ